MKQIWKQKGEEELPSACRNKIKKKISKKLNRNRY